MALVESTFVIFKTGAGTATARPVDRIYTGLYDATALEPDDRPVNGDTYDSATEDWRAVESFELADVDPEAAIPQEIAYTIDTTVSPVTITATSVNAPIEERQERVLARLREAVRSADWTQALDAKLTATSRNAFRDYRQGLLDAPTTFASLWASNPEAIFAEPTFPARPAIATESTDLAHRAAQLIGDGSLLRAKLAARATYDYGQTVALGGFQATSSLTQAALLDFGAIPRGNVIALGISFEGRNASSTNTLTVRTQFRYARAGNPISAWFDDVVFGGSVFTTTYDMYENNMLIGGGYDDLEVRILYSTSSGSVFNVLRNVYLTAVRLTVWE